MCFIKTKMQDRNAATFCGKYCSPNQSVKKCYRKQSLRLHPDQNHDIDPTKMKDLNDLWAAITDKGAVCGESLRDKQKRHRAEAADLRRVNEAFRLQGQKAGLEAREQEAREQEARRREQEAIRAREQEARRVAREQREREQEAQRVREQEAAHRARKQEVWQNAMAAKREQMRQQRADQVAAEQAQAEQLAAEQAQAAKREQQRLQTIVQGAQQAAKGAAAAAASAHVAVRDAREVVQQARQRSLELHLMGLYQYGYDFEGWLRERCDYDKLARYVITLKEDARSAHTQALYEDVMGRIMSTGLYIEGLLGL